MSKEDIFALYCNEIYLGQYGSTGVHGVAQAARVFFDKELKDLNLTEAAAIAAMIKNPNRFAPHKNASEAAARRHLIIDQMARLGLVAEREAVAARVSELALAKPKLADRMIAPYFVDAATRELETKFKGDYLNTNFNRRVYTTIDTHLQTLAEAAVAGELARLDRLHAKKGLTLEATLVALDPQTGHVLAMVGGRDYRRSQFNRATDARRQPGSVFKPFVYAAALERGMTPMTIAADRPTEFAVFGGKPYKPANYGDSYVNENITLKTALARSSNVVAVRTALDTGIGSVARKAREFGFQVDQAYPSLALGAVEVTPLEVAAAYAIFANGGRRVEPTFIDRIVSSDEETIFQATPPADNVVSAKTAYMMTDMLRAVVERGTARAARGALGPETVFAGKTGSSKDGWFAGYTPNLVVVAWVGVDEHEDIKMTGGEAALPLWTEFMKAVVGSRPEFGGANFAMPAGLTEVRIDPQTGMLADGYCPQSETVVVPASMASSVRCLRHQPLSETFVAVSETLPELDSSVTIEPETETVAEPEYETIEKVFVERPDERLQTAPIEKRKTAEPKKESKPIRKTYLEEEESSDKNASGETGAVSKTLRPAAKKTESALPVLR